MSIKIKQLLQNKTYCALPFVHRYKNLDGNDYLCCYSKLPVGDDIADIQKKILSGQPVTNCEICYRWEENGSISPRLKETTGLLKDPKIVEILEKSADDITQACVVIYDIRFDNRCNLACIGCNPKDSSLWAKKYNITVERFNNYSDELLDKIANSRKIYLAGGEPLINQKVFNLLDKISKLDNQPEIVITSNIASIKSNFLNVFKKLNNLSIMVSIDGYGLVNEYHRWPLQWNKFLLNLQILNDMGIYVSWNTVIDAVSIWGLEKLMLIEHLTQRWNLRILGLPTELCLENLPTHLQESAQAQLHSLTNSKFFQQDPVFKSRIQLGFQSFKKSGNPELLANKIHYLDNQRHIDHKLFLGVQLT